MSIIDVYREMLMSWFIDLVEIDYSSNNKPNNGDVVVLDIENAINADGNYDRLFRLTNSFVQWLMDDHLNGLLTQQLNFHFYKQEIV